MSKKPGLNNSMRHYVPLCRLSRAHHWHPNVLTFHEMRNDQ